MEASYEQCVESEQESDQRDLEEASGLAQVERENQEIGDLADQFETREAELRERFDAVAE